MNVRKLGLWILALPALAAAQPTLPDLTLCARILKGGTSVNAAEARKSAGRMGPKDWPEDLRDIRSQLLPLVTNETTLAATAHLIGRLLGRQSAQLENFLVAFAK